MGSPGAFQVIHLRHNTATDRKPSPKQTQPLDTYEGEKLAIIFER